MLKHSLCEGDRGPTRSIFFFGMMNFIHTDFILVETAYDLCEVFIHLEKNINTHAIIGSIEKCSVQFLGEAIYCWLLGEPPCSATNNGYVSLQALLNIRYGSIGM